MPDVSDTLSDAVERGREAPSHLNSAVAILVALTATFMALCNVKDGNITQAMAQAQAQVIDKWSYYQAKSIKQNLAESMTDQLRVERSFAPPAILPALDAKLAAYDAQAKRYDKEKKDLEKEAHALEKEYDALNFRDDQFDMSDAALSVGIALFGITALTQKRWLIAVAIAFMLFGVVMGLAGFFAWPIHPNAFAKFLS